VADLHLIFADDVRDDRIFVELRAGREAWGEVWVDPGSAHVLVTFVPQPAYLSRSFSRAEWMLMAKKGMTYDQLRPPVPNPARTWVFPWDETVRSLGEARTSILAWEADLVAWDIQPPPQPPVTDPRAIGRPALGPPGSADAVAGVPLLGGEERWGRVWRDKTAGWTLVELWPPESPLLIFPLDDLLAVLEEARRLVEGGTD